MFILGVLGAKAVTMMGVDLGKAVPESAMAVVTAANSNQVVAAFVAPGDVPWWQVALAVNALLTFLLYWYADRLKLRGYDGVQKKLFDLGFTLRGALGVATVFGLVYVSASIARYTSLP